MTADVIFNDGQLAVTDPGVFCNGRHRLAEELLRNLQHRPGVTSVCLDLSMGRCLVCWADPHLSTQRAAAAFIAALKEALQAERTERRPLNWLRRWRSGRPQPRQRPLPEKILAAGSPVIVRGPKRLLYLAAGGGSVVMTFVGVIVPGIPTVPFLLASSFFLARSSPRAHALLEATPLFGDMVREWDAHQALSRTSKRRLAVFTLVIIAVTFILAGPNPLVLAVVSVMAPACLIGIIRLPEIGVMHHQPRVLLEKRLPVAISQVRLSGPSAG